MTIDCLNCCTFYVKLLLGVFFSVFPPFLYTILVELFLAFLVTFIPRDIELYGE